MSTEYLPSKKIPWAEFIASTPPAGLRYDREPRRGPDGPRIGHPGKCICIISDKSAAFAWQNCGTDEDHTGTHFELFGDAQWSGNGGRILAAVAQQWGVRMISEIGGLLGENGQIECPWSDVYSQAAFDIRRAQ